MAIQTEIFSNLPEQHLSALETFWKLCNEEGLLARPTGLSENEAQDGLNDETTLLRYLRARRFDPDQSLKQFQQATITHRNNRIPIRYNEIDVLEFETARFLYPHWCGRRTKEGLPICLFDFGHLNRSTLAAYEKTRGTDLGTDTSLTATQRASLAHDYLTRFVFPLCSMMKDRPRPGVPITSAIYLVDLRTFTMKQGWDIKNYTSDIAQLLMMGYPEIIDRLFVLNAPSYFGWMWGIMRKWLDQGTVDKVVIVPASEMMPTLTKYIDTESIPSRFGGEFAWEHGTPLDLDVRIQSGLEWKEEWKEEGKLPPGPMKWVLDESGRKTAIAVGSIEGITRTTSIAQMKVADEAMRVGDPEKNIRMTDLERTSDVAIATLPLRDENNGDN
ncbi:SEC14 cytosolic factor [Penicillium canariense]|uniref:SEC14 cytosolic factor n=1 Tax=Penicillium canariense TaxID=189055 RepID=A0A9W9I460_9EURO|nr:SEC14 cytosolic factor [Penicillium canariense]KAJ5167654.1 SEC14 cytosolic factor [Penicillium canariense]